MALDILINQEWGIRPDEVIAMHTLGAYLDTIFAPTSS
jgi:hypothetical protein